MEAMIHSFDDYIFLTRKMFCLGGWGGVGGWDLGAFVLVFYALHRELVKGCCVIVY